MRAIPLLLFIILCASCQEKSPEDNPFSPTASNETEEATEQNQIIENIAFDPSLTHEEWIYSIWSEVYSTPLEHLVAMVLIRPEVIEDQSIFFIAETENGMGYYSLLRGNDDSYTLAPVLLTSNSWVSGYGNSSIATVSLYDLHLEDVNGDGTDEIIASAEINGMTEAPDGMMPFNKVQHDVLTIATDQIVLDSSLTDLLNDRNGIRPNVDDNLDTYSLLRAKYGAVLSGEDQSAKMENLLTDLGMVTYSPDASDAIFQPVFQLEDGSFVNDLGYLEYDCYFIGADNSFDIQGVGLYQYPIFFVVDHGEYAYQVEQIKILTNKIELTLNGISHLDENTGEYVSIITKTISLTLQEFDDVWVLTYLSNPLMMNQDATQLETINSNEGQ